MNCIVCNIRGAINLDGLCDNCGRSYDRCTEKRDSISDIIEWAAARARYFAARKKKSRK